MKAIILIQQILILGLVIFLLALFCSSSLTNDVKWLHIQSHQMIQSMNNHLENHEDLVKLKVKKSLGHRTDDHIIIESIETIFKNTNQFKRQVDSLLPKGKITTINQLQAEMCQANQSLLYQVSNVHPLFREKEIQSLLLKNPLLPISRHSNHDTTVNNLYLYNSALINYLSGMGSTAIACHFISPPVINIPFAIPKGTTVQGQIFQPTYGVLPNKQKYFISQKARRIKDGVNRLDTTFSTTGKHSLPVQIDFVIETVENFQLKQVSRSIRDTIDIYVFE